MSDLPDTAVLVGRCDWCNGPLTGKQVVACSAGHRAYRRCWLLQIDRGPDLPALEPPEDSPLWQLPDPRPASSVRSRSGLQVSAPKLVRIMVSRLGLGEEEATAIVREALPERQRQRLDRGSGYAG